MTGHDQRPARRGVAVVTGGSAGVGRATVRELAARGWDVGVVARGQSRLDDTVREVQELGRRAVSVSADVADNDAVEAAADRIEDVLGPIDVWVNCAFTGAIAFVNGTRAALARMTPRDTGTVIQVGSSLAFRGIPLQSAYCGAKHAIVGFTESVRVELRHKSLDIRMCDVHLPPSTRRSSTGCCDAASTITRCRCPRSTSPRSPPGPSRTWPSTHAVRRGWGSRPR